MMRHSRSTFAAARRGGFTLLEILLASIIAALVLTAVYMLLNVTMQQTQAGRDAVEMEDVSRGVFNKITIDLSGTLAPLPPKSGGNPAASSGSSSPSTDGTTPPADPAAEGDETTDPAGTENSTALAADYAFQGGVIGNDTMLVIYAGRLPESLARFGNPDDPRADQRQIIYWLGDGGLYRRERPWVTADGVRNDIQNDESAPDSVLLASEVIDLAFEYFDGLDWTSEWDGTAAGPDGVTPLGPPRAIRITLVLQIPAGRGEPIYREMSQVVVIRSAPGTKTPPLVDPPTDGGDNPVTDPSTDPMGGSTQPGGGTTQPGGGTTQPGGGNTQPGGGTKQPSGGTTQPGGGTKQPSGGGKIAPGGGAKGGGR